MSILRNLDGTILAEDEKLSLKKLAEICKHQLYNVDLSRANLFQADLSNANLINANLKNAQLFGVNLENADIQNANLQGANLKEANIKGAILPYYQICPDKGEFIAYKKVANNIVLTIKVLEESKRISTLVSRKCRASKILVLDAESLGGKETKKGEKFPCWYHTKWYEYEVGKIFEAKPEFNDDICIRCAPGIHFFISKQEAIDW